MRISRYLARCGVASRRDSEAVVLAGRVKVNGEKELNLARQIAPGVDHVMLDGRLLELPNEGPLTLLMNKPAGVMVTRDDERARTTIYDILPTQYASRTRELIYAGRLDYNTSGLIILTTDGELANRLVHPRYHVDKTYHVFTERPLAKEHLQTLRSGVMLDDGKTKPCVVRQLSQTADNRAYEITLQEGRNRQVRRMFEAVGGKVVELQRVRLGDLNLRDFFPGGETGVRELKPSDLKNILKEPKA